MKFNIKKINQIAPWIWSPILTAVILMFVYHIRGIYPFGDINISYYDMSQNYIPSYIGYWDALHNSGGFFWDWNMSGGAPGGIGLFFTPLTIFLLIISRDNMAEAMSYFLLIKLMIAAFSMSFFADRKYNIIPKGWKILFGIMYASSAYILLFYTNIQFLEFVMTFPLLIFSLEKIMAKRKSILFILLLAFDLINNVQMTFMVCLYLIIYIFLFSQKSEGKKNVILNLAISTIFAIIMSALYWLPESISTVHTSRASNSSTVLMGNILFMLVRYYDGEKQFTLYGTEVIIAFTILALVKKKINIKVIKNELILCFLTIVPIFIECINVAWHIGGYAQFPMRFAYMLTFSMLLLFGKELMILSKSEDEESISSTSFVKNIAAVFVGILGLCLLIYFILPLNQLGAAGFESFGLFWIACILIIISYALVFLFKPKRITLFFLILCQILIGWAVMLAPSLKEGVPEYQTYYLNNSEKLANEINNLTADEDSRLARVRDESANLTTNYPDAMNISGVSSGYYSNNSNLTFLKNKLGHSTYDFIMMDTGGTIFSDALFHIRTVISILDNSSEIYSSVNKIDGFTIKENNIYYPFGVIVNDSMHNWSFESGDFVEYQNKLISDIHNCDIKLLSEIDVSECLIEVNEKVSEGYYKSSFEIPVVGKRMLYFGPDYSGTQYQLTINGNILLVPDLANPDNSIYPVDYNCGCLYLGLYEDETILLEVSSDNPLNENFIISSLDVELLKEKTEEQHKYEREITPTNNGLKYKVNNTDGYPYLLLPIGFQDKFWCKVNGKFVECEPCVEDALTLIPIEEGLNDISLVYIPRGLITGGIISVIGVLALIIMWKRWDAILEIKWLQNVANVCFTLLFWAIIVCIYIIPTIAEVVLRFIWNPFGI